MHLTRLALTDFRSYADLSLELGPGVTTFSGPNGEGKTNLVEAIGYLATLGSHRVATDAPLIRQGTERAVVRAAAAGINGSALVEVEINPGRANRVRLNRAPLPRPRDILGTVRTVLFAPEDLALVKGDPGERRRFLDELLVATAPRYGCPRRLRPGAAAAHGAAQVGRGQGAPARPGPRVGNGHPGRVGRAAGPDRRAAAGRSRMRLVAALRPHVEAAYEAVSGGRQGEAAGMSYRSSALNSDEGFEDIAALETAILKALDGVRASELDRGVCLVGPHRDELELAVGRMPARGYASHGESWSLALALRLASFTLLRKDHEDPVLLLDDVFAELDTAAGTGWPAWWRAPSRC